MTGATAQGLHVNGRFATRPMTGVDRVAYEMLRALSELGWRRDATTVVIPSKAHLDCALPEDMPVTKTGRLNGTLWEQLELPRAVAGCWLYSPCNVGPLSHRKQIVTIHDAQVFLSPEAYSKPFRTWYKALLPRLGRRARAVTTVSAYSKSMLERFGVLPPDKAVVIHNGADHILRVMPDSTVLQRNGLSPGQYFLAIGSLSPHKNLRTVIEAAARRTDRRFPLVVAGGNSRVFAEANLSETDDTRFLGRVSDAELRALYDNACALVFPSLFEGFGLPPLEAMNCRCPVIASEIPALTEVCGDAVLYADPKAPSDWTRQMDLLAGDDVLRSNLAQRGQQQASAFTWKQAASAFIDLVANAETADR